jgi:hypothetical protein
LDAREGSGGLEDSPTLFARGTHRDVDRIVETVNDAIRVDDTVPATGAAGDLYVCHPFLAHSANPVGPTRPRVISNVCVHGRRRIDLTKPTSAVEQAVAAAFA